MKFSILTVRELMSALASTPPEAWVHVPDSSGSLCAVRAEFNVVPGLHDETGMSSREATPTQRVILLPLDHIGEGWPGGETSLLRPAEPVVVPSERVERVSADGLTKTHFDFHPTVRGLQVMVKLCAVFTYRRASQSGRWQRPEHWALYNHASGATRPAVPPDVLAEVRQRVIDNLQVSAE